jgi:hypothetical protein
MVSVGALTNVYKIVISKMLGERPMRYVGTDKKVKAK